VPDESRYEAAEAIAITTYRPVFNSSPKLAQPELLIFDDAHAGSHYVAEQYAVDISSYETPEEYDEILTALSPLLDGMLVQRLRDPDPGVHQQVRLVVPLRHPGVITALDAVLATLDRPYSFRYAMIRGALKSCLVYLSYSGVPDQAADPGDDRQPSVHRRAAAAVPVRDARRRRGAGASVRPRADHAPGTAAGLSRAAFGAPVLRLPRAGPDCRSRWTRRRRRGGSREGTRPGARPSDCGQPRE
jgi:hypothetical protein